jgi:hypothetical protein
LLVTPLDNSGWNRQEVEKAWVEVTRDTTSTKGQRRGDCIYSHEDGNKMNKTLETRILSWICRRSKMLME